MSAVDESSFDVVVIGGGSSGCVLAARLSEDPARRVLLLEAGPDYFPEQCVPAGLSSIQMPTLRGHNWDLLAIRRRSPGSSRSEATQRAASVLEIAARHGGRALPHSIDAQTTMPYPMGKVVGGGSAVNGALALHARPEDYAEWAALGNPFWGWEQVAPWIAAFDQDDPHRHALPVQTPAPQEWTLLQDSFRSACDALGFAPVALGAPSRDGYSAIPKNVREGVKISTASLYLERARARPNLRVLPNCHVDRLILSPNGRARAVEVVHEGSRRQFCAGRFVLTAGAIHSPAILLRSGIGDAKCLEALGIRPRLDLPGVGRNLVDHSSVSLWGVPGRSSWNDGEPVHQLMLEQSHGSFTSRRDLQLFMLGALPVDDLADLRALVGADRAMGITVVLATPGSRGHVELASDDPFRQPHIQLNCLEDEQDLARMLHGVRLAWRLLQQSPLREHMQRPVLWSDAVVESDQRLSEAVRTLVNGAWHPAGSLRMGSSHDSMAVVDQVGTLHGCSNITAADASIMPSIPGVPTNLTCMLIAERIAAVLRGDSAPQP